MRGEGGLELVQDGAGEGTGPWRSQGDELSWNPDLQATPPPSAS